MKIRGNKIMVVDSGGRGNAIAEAFYRSHRVNEILVVPGNAGSVLFGRQISMSKEDKKRSNEFLANLARKEDVDLTFIGPEAYLSDGIVDFFEKLGLPAVGPNKKAAHLEESKCDAKAILHELGVPVPEFRNFSDPDEARDYVRNVGYPVVVKADGLAAGKGSLVCSSTEEALDAIDQIMVEKVFGSAGDRVDIEKRLYGRELSFFCFTDGKTIVRMEAAQDYKRALDNDEGKNTGGMGCYSPHPWLTKELSDIIMKRVAIPTINGIREKYGIIYKGVIYFGLMLVEEPDGIVPYVLEINVRFGDPEAEVILPRLQTDMVDICEAIIEEKLDTISLRWSPEYHVCVIATSGPCKGSKGNYKGYPGRYKIDEPISGLENVDSGCLVFHSGTAKKDGQLVTTGGRVYCIVGRGKSLKEARETAYQEIQKTSFYGICYRKDIGLT